MSRCPSCDAGLPVLCLDEDGTLAFLTGKLGEPMHAQDIYFGRCRNYRKVRGKNYYKKSGEQTVKLGGNRCKT